MTGRERIKTALKFERPDRLPKNESLWEGTLEAWREQGMPTNISVEDYFDFDISSMYLDPSPRLPTIILEHKDGSITFEDRFGYRAKREERLSATLDFIHFVTQNRKCWEEIKPNYQLSDDPKEPARIDDKSYFMHFDEYPTWDEAVGKYNKLYANNRYMLFCAYGPWEATWRHRGMENQFLDVMEDPEWLREMADTYQDLVINILRKCLDLGMKPDGFFMLEDLGWKKSMFMSLDSWRKIYRPSYKRLGNFLKLHNLDFWMHSDGEISRLLDELIDCGVQVLNPLEVNAGLDVKDLRQKFGKRLAYYGNISIKNLLGPREALEDELRRKIPIAREGGYIIHSDHSVAPQVKFEQYCWMQKRAQEIFADA